MLAFSGAAGELIQVGEGLKVECVCADFIAL